jgi:hypothetical protein
VSDGLNQPVVGQTVLSGSPSAGEVPQQEPSGSAQQTVSGSEPPKWTEQLPREYRDKFASYQSYKDFVGAAAEALETKTKAIVKPGDDAPQEEWDRFYASVGRPTDPSGYEIDGEGVVEEFRKTAHQLGLTKSQAEKLYSWYSDAQKQAEEGVAKSYTATQESLKQDWGDKYTENMRNIERFAKRYGNDALAKELSNPVLGNNPALIKAFARAGAELAPETLVTGKPVDNEKPRPHFEYPWMRDAYPIKE